MNSNEILTELRSLIAELKSLGGSAPSTVLLEFVEGLENSSLSISSKTARKSATTSRSPKKRAAKKQDPNAVAETIAELSTKLKEAFRNDESFEQTVQRLEESGLTKANVIKVYNAVFDTNKSFPKSVTKSSLLNTLRKDRISRVRAAS
jgi:Glu-tRNA(Gln) amidotransferase subunit E-like FAD-binding protein